MIDVKVHENENNQLLSIKGIDGDFYSKQYILCLIRKLFEQTNYVLIRVKRNNYQDPCIERLRNLGYSLGVKDLEIDSDLFEISFNFNVKESNQTLLLILVDLWYAFEQPNYYFFNTKEDFRLNYERILINNPSWLVITNMTSVYVMFKGAEEDVIWLGKSINLGFTGIV